MKWDTYITSSRVHPTNASSSSFLLLPSPELAVHSFPSAPTPCSKNITSPLHFLSLPVHWLLPFSLQMALNSKLKIVPLSIQFPIPLSYLSISLHPFTTILLKGVVNISQSKLYQGPSALEPGLREVGIRKEPRPNHCLQGGEPMVLESLVCWLPPLLNFNLYSSTFHNWTMFQFFPFC